MDFKLSDDQAELQRSARRVAQEVYRPVAGEWDKASTLLPDVERKRLASLGYLGVALPTEYGGGGGSLLDALLVLEELGKECLPAAFCVFEANVGAARVIELFGTEEQRQRWLPAIVEGEQTMAVSISEPDAGSAATDMTTRATRQGDEIVLQGTKRWCSGAGHAELYLVYCRMSDAPGAKGIGAVVVERGTPGFTFGDRESLMGFRGVASADMYFDDCRVPAENVVVGPGGFGKLFGAFSIERLGNATMSLAVAAACLERSAAYVLEREQFGRRIADFQGVQISLAEMVMRTEASRLLLWRAAHNAGRGMPSALEASVAKCFANETARAVADLSVQLFGGYGYSTEFSLERYMRDSVGWAIAGGTPNMQRTRIAAEYLGVRFDQRRG